MPRKSPEKPKSEAEIKITPEEVEEKETIKITKEEIERLEKPEIKITKKAIEDDENFLEGLVEKYGKKPKSLEEKRKWIERFRGGLANTRRSTPEELEKRLEKLGSSPGKEIIIRVLREKQLEEELAEAQKIEKPLKEGVKKEKEKPYEPVECPNCGHRVPSTDRYCVYCGEKLKKEELEKEEPGKEIKKAREEVEEAFEEPEEEK